MAESYPNPGGSQPERQPQRGSGPWILGLILVLIGGYLLLRNLGFWPDALALHNWWALFILIPALGSLYSAWQDYQANGRITVAGRRPLIGGIVLLALVGVFLFNFDWNLLWPVLLILAGISVLLGGRWRA